MESPDNELWEHKYHKIGDSVDQRSIELKGDIVDTPTVSYQWVPNFVEWLASEYFDQSECQIEGKIEPYQALAYPICFVRFLSGYKEFHILEKNRKFDEEDGDTINDRSDMTVIQV